MRIRYIATCCAIGLAAPAVADMNVMAYDADGDSVLTRAEFQALQLDLFKPLDANGDGSVTQSEIDSYAETKGVNASGKRIMARDTNGDGVVTQEEYLAVTTGFDKADANNDGTLAGREITRVSRILTKAGY